MRNSLLFIYCIINCDTHIPRFIGGGGEDIAGGPPVCQVESVRIVGGYAGGADREDALVLALPGMFRHQVAAAVQIRYFFGGGRHRDDNISGIVKMIVDNLALIRITTGWRRRRCHDPLWWFPLIWPGKVGGNF